MWPFTNRTNRTGTIAPEPTDFPDFKEFRESHAKLKVWLPKNLDERLGWLSVRHEVSKPDVGRALLFEHLYGKLAYEELLRYHSEVKTNAVVEQAKANALSKGRIDFALHGVRTEEVQYSARDVTGIDVEHIGRSDWDFTFTMPAIMLEDLKRVASMHVLTPSHYMRKMLVMQLLGERIHTQWQKAIGKIPDEMIQIELHD